MYFKPGKRLGKFSLGDSKKGILASCRTSREGLLVNELYQKFNMIGCSLVDDLDKGHFKSARFRTGGIVYISFEDERFDPKAFIDLIFKEAEETGETSLKEAARIYPIQKIVYADLETIEEAVMSIIPGAGVYNLVIQVTANESISRTTIVENLIPKLRAKEIIVDFKGVGQAILIRVVTSRACVSILEDWGPRKRYNINEYTSSIKETMNRD